jgi:hypothetical protein
MKEVNTYWRSRQPFTIDFYILKSKGFLYNLSRLNTLYTTSELVFGDILSAFFREISDIEINWLQL